MSKAKKKNRRPKKATAQMKKRAKEYIIELLLNVLAGVITAIIIYMIGL